MEAIKVTLGEVPTVKTSFENATVNYDPSGTVRHSDITERSFPDQHPISAITGLSEALGAQVTQESLDLAVTEAVKMILASGELKGEKGDPGPRGEDGAGIQILDSYSSVSELRAEHPKGERGDAYMISGSLYVWSATSGDWTNAGNIKGADGYSPIKGKDYFTDADKAEIVVQILSALPTWDGGEF